MKTVNFILAALATLFLLFCLNGIIRPKSSFELFSKIDEPVEKSWPLIQEKFNLSNFLDNVQEIKQVYGMNGTVGSESDIYINSDGNYKIIRQVITEITPNKSMSFIARFKYEDVEYKLSAMEYKDKTYLKLNVTYIGNNLFTKSYLALFGFSIIEKEEVYFRNFMNRVNQNDSMNDMTIEYNQRQRS